jgi:N-acetylmuramoyl-L-alanine amidase
VALARALAARMRAHGFTPTAYHASRHAPIDLALGIYRRDDLALLNGSTVPAAILECGFISDLEEERELADPATQDRIADAVAGAIEESLGLAGVGAARAAEERGHP